MIGCNTYPLTLVTGVNQSGHRRIEAELARVRMVKATASSGLMNRAGYRQATRLNAAESGVDRSTSATRGEERKIIHCDNPNGVEPRFRYLIVIFTHEETRSTFGGQDLRNVRRGNHVGDRSGEAAQRRPDMGSCTGRASRHE